MLDGNGNPLILPILYVANDDILYVGSAPGLTPDEIDQLTWDQDFVLTNPDGATRDMDQYQLQVDGRGDWWNFSGFAGLHRAHRELLLGERLPAGRRRRRRRVRLPQRADQLLGPAAERERMGGQAAVRRDPALDSAGRCLPPLFSGEFYAPMYEIDGRAHDFYAADGSYFDPRSDLRHRRPKRLPRAAR